MFLPVCFDFGVFRHGVSTFRKIEINGKSFYDLAKIPQVETNAATTLRQFNCAQRELSENSQFKIQKSYEKETLKPTDNKERALL